MQIQGYSFHFIRHYFFCLIKGFKDWGLPRDKSVTCILNRCTLCIAWGFDLLMSLFTSVEIFVITITRIACNMTIKNLVFCFFAFACTVLIVTEITGRLCVCTLRSGLNFKIFRHSSVRMKLCL